MNHKHYCEIEDKKAKCPFMGFKPATLPSAIGCINWLFWSRSSGFRHPGTVAEW